MDRFYVPVLSPDCYSSDSVRDFLYELLREYRNQHQNITPIESIKMGYDSNGDRSDHIYVTLTNDQVFSVTIKVEG